VHARILSEPPDGRLASVAGALCAAQRPWGSEKARCQHHPTGPQATAGPACGFRRGAERGLAALRGAKSGKKEQRRTRYSLACNGAHAIRSACACACARRRSSAPRRRRRPLRTRSSHAQARDLLRPRSRICGISPAPPKALVSMHHTSVAAAAGTGTRASATGGLGRDTKDYVRNNRRAEARSRQRGRAGWGATHAARCGAFGQGGRRAARVLAADSTWTSARRALRQRAGPRGVRLGPIEVRPLGAAGDRGSERGRLGPHKNHALPSYAMSEMPREVAPT
jgi:hypothetical protein